MPAKVKITAAMLYNLAQCPKCFTLDLFGDLRERLLKYNEDDCAAMRALLDGLQGLRVAGEK